MTTLLDALAPDLASLDAGLAVVNGGTARNLASGLRQLAADLDANASSLEGEAVDLDTDGADLRQALADLRAHVATLEPPPPPPPPPRKPIGLRSGLPWLSGERHGNVFKSYLADPDTGLPALEAARGRPVDIELVFVDGWKIASAATWASVCNPLKSVTALPWLASLGIGVVLTIPLFPLGGLDGTGLPSGRLRFKDVADGLYDPVHADLAQRFAAISGLAVLGLRVGWEANNGYPWSLAYAEGDYSLWRQAYARVAGLWKSTFPGAPVALNFLRRFDVNAPTPSFKLDDVLQGDTDWFDVLGADCYTNQLRSGATAADVRAYLGAGSPDRPLGPVTWAAAARARGKFYEVSEWGASRPAFPADDPSRDTGDFPRQMYDHFLANADILAWEALFKTDDFGTAARPGPGYHNLLGPMLPNTRAAYAARWGLA
jgi:hypothetical protein